MALRKYLPTQLIMFKKAGLSHSPNTPQHSVFLFSLPKLDTDLKKNSITIAQAASPTVPIFVEFLLHMKNPSIKVLDYSTL